MVKEENISLFQHKNSATIRLWHWMTFIIITALLITILIQFTILDTDFAVKLIQDKLQDGDISASYKQARRVAKGFRRLIWDWHIYFGYALTATFVFRIILEFFQPKEQKISAKMKQASQLAKAGNGEAKQYLIVRFTYSFFYLLLLTMVFTGLALTFEDDVKLFSTYENTIEKVHYYGMYLILAFSLTHISGVIISELTKYKGIVSNMINGGK